MHKVISINLNGNVYQLDEAGYDTLRQYLSHAEQQLADNPDRTEIVADLEQAIADKCQAFLGPHKTVVSADEIRGIVAEMGPVEGPGGEKAAPGTAETGAGADETAGAQTKRLYRVPAGSMIAGVCTGIAAYFTLDVALVRFAFVVAGFLTKGVSIIAYVVMMFVIPEANSPEEASGGAPLNARDVIRRARSRTAETRREWRRHWRRQRRDWRRHWPAAAPGAYAPSPLAAAILPIFGAAQVALFLLMGAMLISLVNTGTVLDWPLPPDVPVWAAALVLLVGYQVIVSPLRAARHWGASPVSGPYAFWSSVGWLIGVAFAIWLASSHIPEIAEFLGRLPAVFHDFVGAVRGVGER